MRCLSSMLTNTLKNRSQPETDNSNSVCYCVLFLASCVSIGALTFVWEVNCLNSVPFGCYTFHWFHWTTV